MDFLFKLVMGVFGFVTLFEPNAFDDLMKVGFIGKLFGLGK